MQAMNRGKPSLRQVLTIAFAVVALSLAAEYGARYFSEQQVRKRALSPARVLLEQAFRTASEEHDLDLLVRIALVQANAGEVFAAVRTIRSAKSVEWRNDRFADLAGTLSARGQVAAALEVASAMEATFPGKPVTLSKVAQAQASAGDIAAAQETAGGLSGYLQADILEAVALRQVLDNDIRGAFRTFASIDLPGDVARRSRILIAIAVRLADSDRVADALGAAAKVHESWKARALSEVSQALARRKHFTRAARIAASIRNDAYTQAMTFVELARTREKFGDKSGAERHRAVELAAVIPAPEYKSLALRAAAESAAETGDWAAALAIAAEIGEIPHRMLALTSIAIAQRTSGAGDAGRATVASAGEVVRSAKGVEAADNALFWLVEMHVRMGDLPSALAAAPRLADANGISPCLAFSELAMAQAAAGDATGARRSLDSIRVENPNGLVSCTREGSRYAAVEAAVSAKHLHAAMSLAGAGAEQCDMDRSVAAGLVGIGDLDGSARWTYSRGSKLFEGCALLGMAEQTLNPDAARP